MKHKYVVLGSLCAMWLCVAAPRPLWSDCGCNKTPQVQQSNTHILTCGVAAIRDWSQLMGKPLNEAALGNLTNSYPQAYSMSLLQIHDELATLGFQLTALKGATLADIQRMGAPVIAHTAGSGGVGHFVVIERVFPTTLRMIDEGETSVVNRADFAATFTGAMIARVGEDKDHIVARSLQCATWHIDAGEMVEGSQQGYIIHLSNSGRSAVRILDIQAPPAWRVEGRSHILAPGGESEFCLSSQPMAVSHARPAELWTIRLTTDDPVCPVYTISVAGQRVPGIEVADYLYLGSGPARVLSGSPRGLEVSCNGTLRLQRIAPDRRGAIVKFVGDSDDKAKSAFQVSVDPQDAIGPMTSFLVVTAKDIENKVYSRRVSLAADICAPIVSSPPEALYGLVNLGDECERRLRIRSLNGEDFEIKRVAAPNFFHTEVTRKGVGEHELILTYIGGNGAGVSRGDITLILEGEMDKMQIPYYVNCRAR
jgi:hypothetical protein